MKWLAALVLLTTVAAAPEPQTIRPVKPDLYMVTGAGGNSVVWVSNHGLILVDDKIAGEANFNNLVAAIRSVTPLPVRAVFNTHHHADHVGNNARFLEAGVLVIGTDMLAATLEGTAFAPPALLFSRDFSIVLDTGRADAHHYHAGHTGDDAIVYFPSARAVALGGLVVDRTPTFDYEGGANIAGWIATLDEVLKFDFDAAIGGHGDTPLTKPEIVAFQRKLSIFLDRARTAVRGGAAKSGLIAGIRVDDLGWTWTATAWPEARVAGLWAEAGGQ